MSVVRKIMIRMTILSVMVATLCCLTSCADNTDDPAYLPNDTDHDDCLQDIMTDNADTDITDTENTIADTEDAAASVVLDYNPTIDGSIMRGFGMELDISDMITNAEDIINGTNTTVWTGKNGWFKIYGAEDDAASIELKQYTYSKGDILDWTGLNIIHGLGQLSTSRDWDTNESLISTNRDDWDLSLGGVPTVQIQDNIFETNNAYWRCLQMKESTYKNSFEITILPKENQYAELSKNSTVYHGIELYININGVTNLMLNKPNTFVDESVYTKLCDALYEAWGIELPAYNELVLS